MNTHLKAEMDKCHDDVVERKCLLRCCRLDFDSSCIEHCAKVSSLCSHQLSASLNTRVIDYRLQQHLPKHKHLHLEHFDDFVRFFGFECVSLAFRVSHQVHDAKAACNIAQSVTIIDIAAYHLKIVLPCYQTAFNLHTHTKLAFSKLLLDGPDANSVT